MSMFLFVDQHSIRRRFPTWVFLTKTAKSQFCRSAVSQFGCLGSAPSHSIATNWLTTAGKLVFHVFAALAEFERNIIRERKSRA